MQKIPVLAIVVVLGLVGAGCDNATIISPTGTGVTGDGSVCEDANCTAGNVTCGSLTCFGGEQYCAVTAAGCGDGGVTPQKAYACPNLPVTCGQGAGCSCLGSLGAGCSCVEQSGTPIVTCCVADAGVAEASADAPSDGSSDATHD
ncbi:MAG TPA: hypothetical protein VF765_14200 [Polyangiaceae bacterium]